MIKRTTALLFLLLLLTVWSHPFVFAADPATISAQPFANQNIQVVDQLAGSVTAVATDDDYIYVAVGPRLYTLEQANSGQLVELGSSPILGGPIETIHLTEQYAYVAAGFAGLYQLDITLPHAISILAHHDTNGYANRMAQIEQYLYLADWSGGLIEFDLQSGINQPNRNYTPGVVTGVATAPDGDLVLSLGFGGTQRIALDNPEQITVVADLPDPSWDVLTGDGYVLNSNGFLGGGSIIDVSENDQLDIGSPLPLIEVVSSWHLVDATLWLATEAGAIRQVDLADPDQPQGVTLASNLEQVVAINSIQDQLILASEVAGLKLLALDNGAQTAPAGQWSIPAIITDVAIQGNYLYEAAAFQGLIVVDRRGMRPVAQLPLPGRVNSVTTHGHFAYITADTAGLFTVDISDPLAPVVVDQIESPGKAQGVAVAGQYLLLADGTSGMHLYSISDPSAPFFLDSHSNGHDVHDVFIYDGYAYAAAWNGVQILQILAPGTLHFNYQVDTAGYANALTVAEGVLYIADWHGLQLVDVSNLQIITTTNYLELPGQVKDVTFVSGLIFIALGEDGIVVLCGSELNIVAVYDTAGDATNILPVQAELFVADENGGLLQLEQTKFVYQAYLPIFARK